MWHSNGQPWFVTNNKKNINLYIRFWNPIKSSKRDDLTTTRNKFNISCHVIVDDLRPDLLAKITEFIGYILQLKVNNLNLSINIFASSN